MRVLGGSLGAILLVVVAGFLAQRIFGSAPDKMEEAQEAVKALPYRVSVREASRGVLVGRAAGDHGAVVHFAVSESEPDEPSDVPPRLIQVDKNVAGGGGFSVWEDSEAQHHGESAVEWREREEIAAEIESVLR